MRICGDSKEGGTVGLINLRNKEPRNLYSLPAVIFGDKVKEEKADWACETRVMHTKRWSKSPQVGNLLQTYE